MIYYYEYSYRFIEEQCNNHKIPISLPESVDDFLKLAQTRQQALGKEGSAMLEEIERQVKKNEEFVVNQTKQYQDLLDKYQNLIEYKLVLSTQRKILQEDIGSLYYLINWV